MKISNRLVVAGLALAICTLIDMTPGSSVQSGIIGSAHAIIGRPLTPFSYAGVARRSAYRHVAYVAPMAMAATAAVATTAVVASSVAVANANANAAAASQASYGVPIGTIVSQLPQGCVTVPANGVEYYSCNGVTYRTAFQGNNLVYVVSNP